MDKGGGESAVSAISIFSRMGQCYHCSDELNDVRRLLLGRAGNWFRVCRKLSCISAALVLQWWERRRKMENVEMGKCGELSS